MRPHNNTRTRRLLRRVGGWLLCGLGLGILSCRVPSHHDAEGQAVYETIRPDLASFQCATAQVSLLQWQTEQAARHYAPEARSIWIAPAVGPERSVALLVHGLNLRPDKMDPIAHALAQHGIRVLRVTLHGHGCTTLHDFQQVEAADWFYDMLRAYCLAATYARQHGLALYAVGYSLGGSLLVEMLQRPWAQPLIFDAMVLLAPGLALRTGPAALARSASILAHLPWIRDLLPRSKNLPDYACHPGTPLPAYAVERQATEVVRRRGLTGLDHLPTQIFLDPDDELISWRHTQALLREAALPHWSLRPVRKSPGHLPGAPHHLLLDEGVLGSEQWQTLITEMVRHLFATSGAR